MSTGIAQPDRAAAEAFIEEAKKSASAPAKGKDKPTKQVVKDGFNSMGAPVDLDDHLYKMVNWMVQYKNDDGHRVPRFGLFSLMLESTPVYMYDNPVMNAVTKTAFTDGIHLFINADFYDRIKDAYEESGGRQNGALLLIMHELFHKLLRHVVRHVRFDPVLANMGEDLSINTRIQKAWPELEWPQVLRETGLGFGPGEADKYSVLSEDDIILQLIAAQAKQVKQPPKPKGQGGQGQGGQGQPGQDSVQEDPQGAGQSPGGSQGSGAGQQARSRRGRVEEGAEAQQEAGGPPDQFGAPGDIHTISPEELIQRLKEAGYDETLRRMDVDPDDAAAIDQMKKNSDAERIEAVGRAAQQMVKAEARGGKYPGGDIVTYAADVIRAETKGRLRWKLAYREAFYNASMRTKFTDEDTPADIYYVDEVTEMLGSPLFLGVDVPDTPESIVLGIVDISGSMGNPDVRDGVSELFALKRSAGGFSDSASEVLIVMGDTHLRSEVVTLTEDNFEKMAKEGVKRPSCGGTDLAELLRAALALPQVQKKKIRAVVFVTDSYDTAPKFEDLGLKDRSTAIVYAIVPSSGMTQAESFAKATEDYSRTVLIDDNTNVDLTEDFLENMDASPAEQARRSRPRMR